MPKATTVRMSRQGTKEDGTRVRRIKVAENKVAITIFLGKEDALRLAKAVQQKWGKS